MSGIALYSDHELLPKLIHGDVHAYTVFVKRHQRHMEAKATAIAGASLAKDIVQDAWLSVFRNLDKFEGRAALRTWLMVITANTAKVYLYKKRRDYFRSYGGEAFRVDENYKSVDDRLYHHDTPEEMLIMDETCQCFDEVSSNMSERQRLILRQHITMDMSIDEIASEHDITNGNVRVILHRARALLDLRIERV
jgi:RNA polymerase sigma-70 factor (ECF subfamily)